MADGAEDNGRFPLGRQAFVVEAVVIDGKVVRVVVKISSEKSRAGRLGTDCVGLRFSGNGGMVGAWEMDVCRFGGGTGRRRGSMICVWGRTGWR